MPENRVHNRLKKTFNKAIGQRIESWTGTGIFDSNWLFEDGKEAWIEYKQIEAKKSHPLATYNIPWRPAQIAWAKKRMLLGARNLFLAALIGKDLIVIGLDIENIDILTKPIEFKELCKMNKMCNIALLF